MRYKLIFTTVYSVMFSVLNAETSDLTSKLCENKQRELLSYLPKKYNLQIQGTGGGKPCGITHFFIDTLYPNTVSLEKARNLIVPLLLDAMKIVNEDRKIRPHLRDYPFTIENLEFAISFGNPFSPNAIQAKHGSDILRVITKKNYIHYATISQTTPGGIEYFYKETFDEALKEYKKSIGKSDNI